MSVTVFCSAIIEITGNGASASNSVELAPLRPFRDYGYVDGYLATFERAIRATRGVRRHGAAAVDLAWTAAGRFDGYLEASIAPWDVAAGIVLVEAAGGRVTGLWDGGDPVRSGGIVASNGRLHDAIARLGDPLAEAYRRSSGM